MSNEATVTDNTHLAQDFYLVRFRTQSPMPFQAGQYVTFHIGPPKQRHIMSLASPPNDTGDIEILQCIAPNGPGSHWVLGLKSGDATQFTGPLGRFVLHRESKKRKVFIATGCGIAPIRSMILDYLTKGGTDEVVLYWGMRFIRDLFWQNEFTQLMKKYPNFQMHMILSQPEGEWQGLRGHVTEHVLATEQNLPGSELYICGGRDMIREVRELLISRGVPADAVYNEVFF